MKLAVETREIEGSGVIESREFTITASAKAFRILSDGLYTDKISTILRELACNAVDAHIEAGTADRQFDLKLPNHIDPIFRIRDYGTGISHEDVMNLYSTYFMSTKTNTNTQIGALGLGSKSPFSYTDSFTVISYFNGKKSIYTANIGSKGIPEIHLMLSQDNDEHNGLEVSFAVKETNFCEFETKARTIYRHFDPLPNVTGVEKFEIDIRNFVLAGKNWQVYTPKNNYSDNIPLAIMGLIEYPIEYSKLIEVSDDDKKLLQRLPVAFNFKIGELDITSNREALSYDARTSKNIVKHVKQSIEQISKEIGKKFTKCKTLWDAKILFWEMVKSNQAIETIVKRSNINLQFNGQRLDNIIEIDFCQRSTVHWSEEVSVTIFTKEYSRKSEKREARGRKFTPHHNRNYQLHIRPKKSTELFVDDLGRGATPRLKAYLNAMEGEPQIVLVAGTKTDIITIKNILGVDKFKKVSSLPKPVKRTCADGNPVPSIRIWQYMRKDFGDKFSRVWKANNAVTYSDGGIYVPLKRHIPQTNITGVNYPSGFNSFLDEANILGILVKTDVLYGVPVSQVKKLEKTGTWLNLFDLVRTGLEKKAKSKDFREKFSNNTIKDDIWDNISDNIKQVTVDCEVAEMLLTSLNEIMSFVDNNIVSAVADFEILNIDTLDAKELKKTISIMENMGIEIKKIKTTINLEKTINAIIKTYPMISLMFSDSSVFVQEHYYNRGNDEYTLKSQFTVMISYVETFAPKTK